MVLTHEMIWYIKWNEMVPPKWNDKSNQLLKILNEYDNWDQASHVSWRHDSKEIKQNQNSKVEPLQRKQQMWEIDGSKNGMYKELIFPLKC